MAYKMSTERTYYNRIPVEQIEGPVEGERRIIKCNLFIDYDCFRKTPEERRRLKMMKARHRREQSMKAAS